MDDTETVSVLMQPTPIGCDVVYTRLRGGYVTGIMREWKPGDTKRCRLCPPGRCTAAGRDHCLVAVAEYVSTGSAPLLSMAGRVWQDIQGGTPADVDAHGHRSIAST